MLGPALLGPNERDVIADTPGIARNMQAPPPMIGPLDLSPDDGGGDLNGTAAVFYLHQSGTACDRFGLPRAMAANGCGVV